ncbi:hypothetical protein HDV02_005712 [Globomyces sp. JEL0801]|nr:hypothetical protein HDV02_005712 [Globomyces sp. JEL0801]
MVDYSDQTLGSNLKSDPVNVPKNYEPTELADNDTKLSSETVVNTTTDTFNTEKDSLLDAFKLATIDHQLQVCKSYNKKTLPNTDTIHWESSNPHSVIRLFSTDDNELRVKVDIKSTISNYDPLGKLRIRFFDNLMHIEVADKTPSTMIILNPYDKDYQYCTVLADVSLFIPKDFKLNLNVISPYTMIFNHDDCKLDVVNWHSKVAPCVFELRANEINVSSQTGMIRIKKTKATKLRCMNAKDHSTKLEKLSITDSVFGEVNVDVVYGFKLENTKVDNLFLLSKAAEVKLDGCDLKQAIISSQTGPISITNTNYEDFKISGRTSNLDLMNVNGNNMKLLLKSGRIIGNQVESKCIEISKHSGSIGFNNSQFGILQCALPHGDITLNDVHSDWMNILSDFGSVELSNFTFSNRLFIQTNSSPITLIGKCLDKVRFNTNPELNSSFGNIQLQTSTGSIKTNIHQYKVLDILTCSGNIDHNYECTSNQQTRIKATDGNITINVTKLEAILDIKTTSGTKRSHGDVFRNYVSEPTPHQDIFRIGDVSSGSTLGAFSATGDIVVLMS